MKRFSLLFVVVAFGALLVVPMAMAQTVPAIPVAAYGSELLASLLTAITSVLPYAAAITAFAVGVGMIRRWLGHRKATQV